MHATDIAAYTYRADTYHPQCVLRLVKADHPLDYPLASTIMASDTPEDILRTVAKSMRLDNDDVYSFDSDDFPKVVFADQIENAAADGVYLTLESIPDKYLREIAEEVLSEVTE